MTEELDKKAAAALDVISQAAAEATHVVASAAAEAVKVRNAETSNDHDLIQRMDEKLDALGRDFRDLKDGTADRIKKLEEGKVNEIELDKIYSTRTPQWKDYNTRIENLENWKNWVLGIFTLIGVVITLVIYIYFANHNNLQDQIQDLKILLQQHVISKE